MALENNINNRLKILLKKYLEEEPMTPTEIKELNDFIHEDRYRGEIDALLAQAIENKSYKETIDQNLDELYDKMMSRIKPVRKISSRNMLIFKYAVAVTLLTSLFLGLYYYKNYSVAPLPNSLQLTVEDILPGGNRALLTLSDGNTISLSDSSTGIIIDGDKIAYHEGATVLSNTSKDLTAEVLSLKTPYGGQYQVTLADGTRVWLNAATTLIYPSSFVGSERRVELIGEAYFEVAENAKQPFIVISQGQEVTVLGTHFNINSYPDELAIKTTLIEGAVSITSAKSKTKIILSPGQQAILEEKGFVKRDIDPSASIAWKNGFFQFDNADLKTVMRQITRWYDLDVEYKGQEFKEVFNGKVYRNMNLGQVLEILNFSNVKFQVEGKKLIVYSK